MSERYAIDVGGWLYTSTLATLQKSPVLKKIIENHTGSDAIVFIDRDPTAFGHVLNFLRNGTVHAGNEDRCYLEFLLGEASYYGLRKMEQQISKTIESKRKVELEDIVAQLRKTNTLLEQVIGKHLS